MRNGSIRNGTLAIIIFASKITPLDFLEFVQNSSVQNMVYREFVQKLVMCSTDHLIYSSCSQQVISIRLGFLNYNRFLCGFYSTINVLMTICNVSPAPLDDYICMALHWAVKHTTIPGWPFHLLLAIPSAAGAHVQYRPAYVKPNLLVDAENHFTSVIIQNLCSETGKQGRDNERGI